MLTEFALGKLGSSAVETVYVGDSPYDFETAKNADMECLLVDTGTHSFEELSSLNKGFVFKDLRSVTDYILESWAFFFGFIPTESQEIFDLTIF